MSGGENARHSSVHSIGPKEASATPSWSVSRATTLNASSGCGQPPRSPAFVATESVAFALCDAKRPWIDVTLQTGKPSPREPLVSIDGLTSGVGGSLGRLDGLGKLRASDRGTAGAQEIPTCPGQPSSSAIPNTRSRCDPSSAIFDT